MNKLILFLTYIIIGLSFHSNARQDSLKTNKIKLSALYLGVGTGLHEVKYTPGLSGTFILSNNWGAGYSYKSKYFNAKNLPSDYEVVEHTYNIPEDNQYISSFTVLKEFPTKTKMVRFGIEAGPSWVKYKMTNFKFIPSYQELKFNWAYFLLSGDFDGSWYLGDPIPSRYEHSYTRLKAMGLSFRAKIEFPLTHFVGCEFAIHGNINKFRSFIGAEVFLTFGKVRERLKPKDWIWEEE